MPKKFMYVCLGILALVIAFHLGAQYGQASLMGGSIVAAGLVVEPASGGNDFVAVTMSDGSAWLCGGSFGGACPEPWQPWSDPSLPVPFSSIKFLGHRFLVTDSDEVYIQCQQPNTLFAWINMGSPGEVANESTTWSQIKAEFGE